MSLGASSQWPQWRGPGGTGISPETKVATEWSAATDKTAEKNIKWKVEIPGQGHSSPVISNGRVFLTTAIKGAEVPGKKAPPHLDFNKQPGYLHPDSVDVQFKHALKVFAIDAKTGKVVWEKTAYDGEMWDDRHRRNTFASSTMAADGERAYAFFESAGLYAYNFDGTLAWKRLFPNGIIKAGLGPGTSPIVYKDLVIIQCDQEMGDGSFILALNRKTGEDVWRAERTNRRSWATPLIVNTGTRDELIASGAEVVISYDPLTGKELWKSDGTRSHPIPSPVSTKGLVFLTAGSSAKVVLAMKPTGEVVWRHNKGAAYVPSPIAIGDYLYLVSDGGIMTCLDALTGTVKYEGGRPPVPGAFFASPIAFGDKILLTSDAGDSFVIKQGPVHEVVATNSIGETVWASPAIADGTIFIRGDRHLFAIGEK